jgi:hypothetical protein
LRTQFLGHFVFKEQPMKLTDLLTSYIAAAFTGIWVTTHEADEAEREITQHARRQKWKVAIWDVASGLRVPGANVSATDSGAGDPLAALRALPAMADDKARRCSSCTTSTGSWLVLRSYRPCSRNSLLASNSARFLSYWRRRRRSP